MGPVPSPLPVPRVSVWLRPPLPAGGDPVASLSPPLSSPGANSEAGSWQVLVRTPISTALLPALPLRSHPAVTVARTCTHPLHITHPAHSHTSHTTHTTLAHTPHSHTTHVHTHTILAHSHPSPHSYAICFPCPACPPILYIVRPWCLATPSSFTDLLPNQGIPMAGTQALPSSAWALSGAKWSPCSLCQAPPTLGQSPAQRLPHTGTVSFFHLPYL